MWDLFWVLKHNIVWFEAEAESHAYPWLRGPDLIKNAHFWNCSTYPVYCLSTKGVSGGPDVWYYGQLFVLFVVPKSDIKLDEYTLL